MLTVGPRRRNRTGAWFVGLVALSVLMLATARTDQALALQDVTGRILGPVRSAIAGFVEGAGGLFSTFADIDRLRRENASLREAAAGADESEVRVAELEEENRQLRELLGVREALELELLPVNVITRDPGNFTREIGIDAGTRDGVEAEMVVVGGGGTATLIGRVAEAFEDHARVRLIIDTRSAVIALDQETRAVGIVEGRLGGQLVLSDVPVTEQLAVGDAVLTAGLEVAEGVGSGYPSGLLIGYILDVEEDPNGLTQTAFVEPAADFNRLERLLVITRPGPE